MTNATELSFGHTMQHGLTGANGGGPLAVGNASAGPRSKCDQVIFETICKACEVIVGSRSNNAFPNDAAGRSTKSNGTATSAVYGGSYSNKSNNNTLNSTTSTRFNLQIPEISGIREIMSQYRNQLHATPFRLDVYYQHPNGSRELLERWCFEYRPCSSSEKFLEAEGMLTTTKQDPMVQLRHVWKRIVIWLRTLYVFSRFLPSHGFRSDDVDNNNLINTDINSRGNVKNNIGFSLYINRTGSDDINLLVQQQGFVSQSSPSGHITTPYGQLVSHVVYLPAAALAHLLPPAASRAGLGLPINRQYIQSNNLQTQSKPIPMNSNNDSTNDQNNQAHAVLDHDYKRQLSAPSAMMQIPTDNHQHQRSASYTERIQHFQHSNFNQKNHLGTYDPSRFIPPRRPDTNHQSPSLRPILQRRHTSIETVSIGTQLDSDKPPERVMSGLSLALMMANIGDKEKRNIAESQSPAKGGELDETPNAPAQENDLEKSSHEKRRAALHQLPPHLVEHPQANGVSASPRQQHPATSNDYGYAYNNSFPWQQKLNPSNAGHGLTPQTVRSSSFDSRSASPSHFHAQNPLNTPPVAAFIGSVSTPNRIRTASSASTAGSFPANLIPPRRSSSSSIGKGEISLANGCMTPPFHDRPLGFLQEPSVELPELETNTDDKGEENPSHNALTLQHQLTSLDLLHSSPFQLQQFEQSTLLSSLPQVGVINHGWNFGVPGTATSGDLDSVIANYSNWTGSGTLFGHSPRSAAHAAMDDSYFFEDTMPFAVELSSPAPLNSESKDNHQSDGNRSSNTDSLFAQSATLTSLAQKCAAPNHRLKLFESGVVAQSDDKSKSGLYHSNHAEDLVTSLAEQLDQFRAFGASIHISANDDHSEQYE